MADLAAIITFVSGGSKLSLKLFRLAATAPWASKTLREVATALSNFSLIIKQTGAIIKEDDRVPSGEALESIQDIIEQCKAISKEIEGILPTGSVDEYSESTPQEKHQYGSWRPGPSSTARLEYLATHLKALQSTLATMLQAFYTTQTIMWARTRPTISPKRTAKAVDNEKNQLEALIFEQQIAFIQASKIYDEHHHTESLLLMEEDSSKSLAIVDQKKETMTPSDLFHYQHPSLANLDSSNDEHGWCFAVSEITTARVDQVLQRWTRLQQLQAEVDEDERRAGIERRQTQQPTVDSESDDDELAELPGGSHRNNSIATPIPLRSVPEQPLFSESPTLPIPVPSTARPTAPLSPASSFGVSPSASSKIVAPTDQRDPGRFDRGLSMFPGQATAAVDAHDEDDSSGLEIPWKLCSRTLCWEYIDDKVKDSNTDTPPTRAFEDSNSWTELMASWVCEEAIKEAGYGFTRVQKERRDGRRTTFEPCFCIQRPLRFAEVHRLVERTVDIYRQNRPATPPSSEKKHQSSSRRRSSSPSRNRDRASTTTGLPPMARAIPSLPVPPPSHLDRSTSLPGQFPPGPPNPYMNPRSSAGYLPNPNTPLTPQGPYAPQQNWPQPQPPLPNCQPTSNAFFPPPPRQPYQPYASNSKHNHSDDYSSDITSDIDETGKSRRRKPKRSSARRGSNEKRRKSHSTVGTLAKVGGLAALLDGVVDLGIL